MRGKVVRGHPPRWLIKSLSGKTLLGKSSVLPCLKRRRSLLSRRLLKRNSLLVKSWLLLEGCRLLS